MPTSLLDHIARYIKLTNEEQTILPTFFKPKQLRKKEYLLKEGQVCNASYFVCKGCMRMYHINDKGVEQTTHFAIENWWLADYMSLDRQTPSIFNIQAVEACEILVLEKRQEEALFTRLPKMERYFRIVFQKATAASQLRIKYLYDFTGEERYHHFHNSFPQFVQRIPQYMLASYLGFTAEFLSKIRAKKM